MRIFKAKRLKKGFTLIEMLVIVSIIGILVSIAGFNNSRVLRNSRDAALKLEINELRTAIYRYSLNNGGSFPGRLEDMAGNEVRQVPSRWSAANADGRYHYDAEKGSLFLYDESGEKLSEAIDQSGKKYGDY
jgi:prepilin-type N-terminal cleavage/methylation domain-containing protein